MFLSALLPAPLAGIPHAGVWGAIRDTGFADEDLEAIGASLQPVTSAVIAIAEDTVVEQLQDELRGYQRITRHAVSADAAALITAEADFRPAT